MIKTLVQLTLDTVLYPKGIYVYEQRKSGEDTDQYIVYSANGDSKESFADDKATVKNATATIRYYYRSEKLDNYETKLEVREVENLIEEALENAGFEMPFGKFDGGDVDDIGFHTTIFECEYWRVI